MAKTIKQIADEIGVSKTAVRKKIENLGLSDKLRTSGNQFLVDSKQETLIKSTFLKSQPKTENCKPVTVETESFRLVSDMVDTLKMQLEAKDIQLAEKDKQIADQQESIRELTGALADTANSLKAAQALHAGTMQHQLENPESKKKEGFFSKFFKQ